MTWKPHFERGITLYKLGKPVDALNELNEALKGGGENQFILYDTRAAIHEALDSPKDALRDAKTTIQLAPERWQGYARAARLFMKTHKLDPSFKMIQLAVSYTKPTESKRLEELLELKREIENARDAMAMRVKRIQNHMLKLPAELYSEIFQLVLAEDYAEVVTLLHICTHWRKIIWNSPTLWSTLVLSKSRADQKAALWLERSNGRIRELHVLHNYHLKEIPGQQTFLDKIDWSYLRVCRIHNSGTLKHIDKYAVSREMDHLEIFEATLGSYKVTEPLIFPSFRKLRSLSLAQAVVFPRHFQDPFPSLTSLNIESSHLNLQIPDGLLTLLRASPRIESIQLKTIKIHPSNLPGVPLDRSAVINPPSLDHLTTLELDKAPGFSMILLLDIPALQTLRLDNFVSLRDQQELRYWLSTSPKFLTEFSLKSAGVDMSLLLAVLHASPKLEVLILNHMFGVCNEIIQVLSKPTTSLLDEKYSSCLCPRLRYLDVSHCPDVETSVVQEFVKQRIALSSETESAEKKQERTQQPQIKFSKLEVLKLDGCEKIDPRWLPWFVKHVPEVSCYHGSLSKAKRGGVARRMNGL